MNSPHLLCPCWPDFSWLLCHFTLSPLGISELLRISTPCCSNSRLTMPMAFHDFLKCIYIKWLPICTRPRWNPMTTMISMKALSSQTLLWESPRGGPCSKVFFFFFLIILWLRTPRLTSTSEDCLWSCYCFLFCLCVGRRGRCSLHVCSRMWRTRVNSR